MRAARGGRKEKGGRERGKEGKRRKEKKGGKKEKGKENRKKKREGEREIGKRGRKEKEKGEGFRKIRRNPRKIRRRGFADFSGFLGYRRQFRDSGDSEVDRPAGLRCAQDSRHGG
jgi:hypothetical protein